MAAAAGTARQAGAAPRVGLLYDQRMLAHAPARKKEKETPERLRAIWRKLAAEGVTSRRTFKEELKWLTYRAKSKEYSGLIDWVKAFR